MKRWLKLLSKSNPKRKNACHRNKETNKTNKCGLRQNRSVPLPFHSPYSKYTTKINEQFQLEQKKIQIYSNPSKKHPSQQKQQHIPHRMTTNTPCNIRTSTRTHATSIGDRRKMNDAAAAKKMTNHSKSPETICQALLLMCFIRNTLVCARSILKRKYNHCVAAWCVCISFHFNLVDHTKCFFSSFIPFTFFNFSSFLFFSTVFILNLLMPNMFYLCSFVLSLTNIDIIRLSPF